MSTLNKTFNPAEIEEKRYQEWENSGAFYADPESPKKPYTIMIPPPNVTGSLHIGHAFTNTMQDILIRYHRMRGYDTLWQPGTDHASIAVHMVLENQLAEEGKTRYDLGREKFMEKAWAWKEHSGGTIINQLKRLGCSADWSRERFTMDEGLSSAVTKLFVKWYNEKIIYKANRLVNWDPKRQTVISDIEVIQKETKGHMWHLQYPIEGEEAQTITVATTRPETMFGDVAVAVNPEDPRYKDLIGKFAVLPIVGRLIPIVGDEHADPEQGSGAVKITPAHDFNDFEVAQRHKLEMISVFDEKACLNDKVPSAYRGLPRYEARKKVLQELEALEAIEKVEDHVNVTPYGERSDEVIEPFLTEQWYVDAETLAKPALEAVRTGKVEFVPKQWENTYFHWLENIQPWCISRQLWWGHQIPAWYGPDGEVFVAEDEASAQEKADAHYGEKTTLKRDQDVLDTWFSSQLWPFSTLGWPEQTVELKKYYPTDVLVTGFDIIFFWVARMIMSGINVMGEVPFSKVYMHGLVRDAHGQKMSKSKGNVINPLDIVDKYGADALRFTLTALAASGRDIKLSESRIEGYRNFGTKLWNAARYCEMQNALPKAEFDPATVKSPLNKWIIGALMDAIDQVDKAFAAYRFNDVANAMYQFVWNNFCDWYLEFTKPIMYGKEGDEALQAETRATTGFVLQQIITMLNPVMPYITEELNKAFQGEGRKLLLISPWPELDKKLYDKQAMSEIDWLCRLIMEIRSVRSDMNVPASQNVRLIVNNASAETKARLERYKAMLSMMAKIGEVETDVQNPPKGSIQSVVDEATIMLPIAGLIDLDKERERLKKQISKLEQELKGIMQRLDNKQFISNAPEEVVSEQKEKAQELETALDKYSSALKQLEVA